MVSFCFLVFPGKQKVRSQANPAVSSNGQVSTVSSRKKRQVSQFTSAVGAVINLAMTDRGLYVPTFTSIGEDVSHLHKVKYLQFCDIRIKYFKCENIFHSFRITFHIPIKK